MSEPGGNGGDVCQTRNRMWSEAGSTALGVRVGSPRFDGPIPHEREAVAATGGDGDDIRETRNLREHDPVNRGPIA